MRIVSLLAVLFVSIAFSYGQAYIKPKVLGTLNPSSSNNSVVIETFNLPPLSWLSDDDGSPNWQYQYVFSGDTINNFGIYSPWNAGIADYITVFCSNGYLSSSLLQNSALPVHLNYNVIDFVAASSDSTSDGSLTIQFDSLNILGNYEIDVLQDGWNGFDTTHLNATTVRFNFLEYGYFKMYWLNSMDNQDFAEISMYLGDLGAYYDMQPMDVDLAVQHDSNNCDGWILANPVNVSGNLYSAWSDEIYNTSLRTNLCPGFYSVFTYETSIQTAEWVSSSTDTIVIANDGTSYIDSNLFTNPVQDTVYFNGANCNFDYNAPIDSVSYLEDTVFNNGSLVIVTFDMTMYQDTTVVTFSDSLVLINDSLIMVDVVIYCGGFPRPINWEGMPLTEKLAFNSRRVALLRGVDDHVFYQNGVGLIEKDLTSMKLYPNPTSNELIIEIDNSISNGSISITNLNGQLVYSKEKVMDSFISIDVTSYSNGVYLVHYGTEEGVIHQKFIKE